MDKREFRKIMKEKRGSLNKVERMEKDQTITEKLLDLSLVKDAKTIFVFLNFRDEVKTRDFISAALQREKTICLPKIAHGKMIAVEVNSLKGLKKNAMGILEPEGKAVEDMDLILCPGLAFDLKGYRMGYGGGYYDRFLETHPDPVTLGLGYDIQLVPEVPHESFDIPLDYFLSESYFISCEESPHGKRENKNESK